MATTVVATVNTVLLELKTNETFLIGSFNNDSSSPLADFGRLRKTLDFFGNLRK